MSAAPKRLLILESNVDVKPEGFDHVFSIAPGPADSYPLEYILPDEDDRITDAFFERFSHFYEQSLRRSEFVFRGVDIFRCFKKTFLNLGSFCDSRFELLGRVLRSFPLHEVWVEDHAEDLDAPFMKQLILSGDSKASRHFQVTAPFATLHRETIQFRTSLHGGAGWWPAQLSWGSFRGRKVAFFSDIKKISSVLDSVGRQASILFTDVRSPRIWWEAALTGCAYNQIVLDPRDAEGYNNLAKKFQDVLRKKNLFQGLGSSGLDWSDLMWRKAQALFKNQLPELLCKIDAMHAFFEKASALQGALLDEDIAPAKNAFCQVAAQHQVPAYVVCHGSVGKKSSYLPLTASKIFVWGRSQREKLKRWGLAESRIVVSGSGRYSPYLKMNVQVARKKITTRFKMDPSQKIVLVAFTNSAPHRRRLFVKQQQEFLGEVMELIHEYPEVQFIIKAKNKKDANSRFCRESLEKRGLSGRAVLIEEMDPLLLIKSADLAIVHATTFGIDALALGCPTISYHDRHCTLWEEFKSFDAFLKANSREELRLIFGLFLKGDFKRDDPRFDHARRECLNSDGPAPEEIIAPILLSAKK